MEQMARSIIVTDKATKAKAKPDSEAEKFVYAELSKFLKLCPKEQDPVLSVLRIHLLAEYHLERLCLLSLVRGDKIPSGSFGFAQKLNIVEAIDVLDDRTVQSLKNLNRVRNLCAHEFDKTITASDIEDIGRPFGREHTKIKRDAGTDLQQYLISTLSCVCKEIVASIFVLEQRQIPELSKE